MNIGDEISAKRDELRALETRAAMSCADGRHDWQHVGGRNPVCCDDCVCSVPVYRCAGCGDFDYGDNAEAAEIQRDCAQLPLPTPHP